MRPTPRLLTLLFIWITIGLLVMTAQLANWPVQSALSLVFWSYLVFFALISFIDYRSLAKPPEFSVTRSLPAHLALGVRQLVDLRISNASHRSWTLQLTDLPPEQINYQGLPVELELSPQQFAEVRYSIYPVQRGSATFAPVSCLIDSQWKLWQRKFAYAESEETKIYPNYKPLFRSTFLNSEQLFHDLGIRVSQRRGEGTDFRQLREFRTGDSLRQIDWRATARFNKPISREYQDERDQQVIFMLDCGRRMRAKDSDISHFDHALNALLISAFIALRQGDSVGLFSFAGEPRWVAPIKGQQQVNHLLDHIYDLHSTLDTSDYIEAAQQLISRYPKRSLVILISSIEPEDRDDLNRAIHLLNQHHLVMVASMRPQIIDQVQQSEVVSLNDALRLCGASQHEQKRQAMLTGLRNDRVIVTDTLPSHMHASLISEYLSLKRSGAF